MKLIKCTACERDISPNATTCPHCGEPLKEPAKAGNPGGINMSDPVHAVGMVLVVLMLIGIFFYVVNGLHPQP